jgi:hypothetical protein
LNKRLRRENGAFVQYPNSRETFEGAVHGIGVYSAWVGPKGPALERFLDIKKKKIIFNIK